MSGYCVFTNSVKKEYEKRARRMGGIFPSTISVESILAWQDVCAAEYRIEEDYLCIRIYDRIEKKSYLYMPLGMYSGESFQRLIGKLYGESRKDGVELLFRDVREEEIFWYRGLSGYRVRISSNEAYSDYIYRREELEQAFEKPGERYNKRYFIRNYQPSVRHTEILDISSCRDIVNRAFCRYHQCPSCTNGCLKDTIANFLEASDPKGTYGIIVSSNGDTILVSTPAYALYMADVAEKIGVDMDKIKLRLAMFGGEGHTEEMRRQIEKRWHLLATENYGLSEIGGPGYSGECYKQDGMHIADDMFITEIVDPDTLEPLPMGEKGELVITPLVREAMPVLRYRTKDISWLNDEPCACGRKSLRMAKIQGRTDDMLIIRGVNVFPSQIESVLMAMSEVEPHYEIVVTRENYMDRIEVKVEVSNPALLDKFTELEQLRGKIRHNLYKTLNIDAKVTLVSGGTLKRFEGKAKRVTDLRNL